MSNVVYRPEFSSTPIAQWIENMCQCAECKEYNELAKRLNYVESRLQAIRFRTGDQIEAERRLLTAEFEELIQKMRDQLDY